MKKYKKDERRFVENYKGYDIFTNGRCHSVILNDRERYFHAGGDTFDQINRCMKEIDDFETGDIV